jgi:hypothetical protein
MSNFFTMPTGHSKDTRNQHYFASVWGTIDGVKRVRIVGRLLALVLALVLHANPAWAEAPHEGYFGYLFEDGGDYPVTWTETRYSTGFAAMTHDEDNWYTAQSDCWRDIWNTVECVRRLWKIPLEVDLNTNNQSVWWELDGSNWLPINPPGVQVINLPDLRDDQYKLVWVRDLAFHRKDGQGYLFVEGTLEEVATGVSHQGIAVINPETFTLIDLHVDWPICIAASPDSRLVSINWSDIAGTSVAMYVTVDWNALATQGQLVLNFPDLQDPNNVIPIRDSDGSSWSGPVSDCDVSPSGGLLYMVLGGSCVEYNRIEVADLTIGKIVQVSTNSKVGDIGHFDVRYDPSTCSGVDGEYFNGLTIWDLDADPRAPGGIHGKLHIVAVEDDEAFDLSDDIRMMHYSEEIHVVKGSTVTPERGTLNLPYNTVAEAIAGGWDYSILYIWGSSFPESVVFDKKMLVVPLVFTPPYSVIIGE